MGCRDPRAASATVSTQSLFEKHLWTLPRSLSRRHRHVSPGPEGCEDSLSVSGRMSLSGLGRVKTRTRCGAVEWRSQASDVLPSRARLRLARPPMQRRRNLEKSAVPTLLVPGSRPGFHATMCRTAGDLGACWNRILTIFDPYTFLRSQGHSRHTPNVRCQGKAVIAGRTSARRVPMSRSGLDTFGG